MLFASLGDWDTKSAAPSRIPYEDRRLIAGVLASDPSAQRRFVGRYDRFIHAILYRHLPGAERQEREDLGQQVYVLLWDNHCRRLRQWQGAGGTPFSAYLGTIVRHLIADHLRTKARSLARRMVFAPPLQQDAPLSCDTEEMPESRQGGATNDPQAALERKERLSALAAALNELSERDGYLIRQKHLQEKTYREIAESLGMTVNHVGVALSRAEKRLRRYLRRQNTEIFPEILEGTAGSVINPICLPSPRRDRPATVRKSKAGKRR